MNYRIVGLAVLMAFAAGPAATCFAQGKAIRPVSGMYVYGPPTAGQSTSVAHYPKNWRGPRYSYPQTYYFKNPPFRRPLTLIGGTPYIDQTFFTGATTDAEIWAIRRKGEVPNLPASARVSYPAQTGLAPVIGPLPKRQLSPATADRRRPAMQRRLSE
ncbi:MAG TPA: hypothetical protein VHC22_30690 [Pirellulales bacterium]|nr:hypothetical protein [Pirellulales bacterium]